MYNHYKGSGPPRRVDDEQHREQQAPQQRTAPPPQLPPPCRESARPPGPKQGMGGELGRLFSRLGKISLETEDILLLAVLYLMYRESGDEELLIMMGALILL